MADFDEQPTKEATFPQGLWKKKHKKRSWKLLTILSVSFFLGKMTREKNIFHILFVEINEQTNVFRKLSWQEKEKIWQI